MNDITVGLKAHAYHIHIQDGLLQNAGSLVENHINGGVVPVVTDSTVWEHHGKTLAEALAKAGIAHQPVILPPGEDNKSLDGLARLYDSFADARLRRDGLVIAFGGGVIGDLCGFAAATYMRGVRYLQIPTTLLAQVDSSVGGKTAVNLPQGKNLAGAFYQPCAVLIDPILLSTLPGRELRCGLAEVIKYGSIRSNSLFDSLEQGIPPEGFGGIIAKCCQIKSDIVARDERDTGERMLLNFGHTFGHAVEALGDFSSYNHGEGVAIGMAIAALVGEALSVTPPGTYQRLQAILRTHGLPTTCPYPAKDIMTIIALDKKSSTDGIHVVLLKEIGRAITQKIGYIQLDEILKEVESQWMSDA